MRKEKLYISWDALIEIAWEHMRSSHEEGFQPDLITELVGWLEAILWEYDDYEIIVEGCDFRLWHLRSYEDVMSFIEAYETELMHDNEIFYEEVIKENQKKEVEP